MENKAEATRQTCQIEHPLASVSCSDRRTAEADPRPGETENVCMLCEGEKDAIQNICIHTLLKVVDSTLRQLRLGENGKKPLLPNRVLAQKPDMF